MKTWIQTLTNKKLEPLALTVEMVGPIEEIAHALAGEFRYTRQTAKLYSVAEHCVRGSRLIDSDFALAFLLHELSEVYLPDVAGPLKPSLYAVTGPGTALPWADLEKQHTHVMLEALGLAHLEPLIYSPHVKGMDLAMLASEKAELCGPEPEDWGLTVDPAPTGTISPWSPELAEMRFLARFKELTK